MEGWDAELACLHDRFGDSFLRSEPRQRALRYMWGLLAPLERKNGWTLAEDAGEATPDGMQRLLNDAVWDADEVRDRVREYVVERLGDPEAVLVGDDTGFLKKGTESAGVQRQYSGTAGRTENCQIGTFLAYASRHGRTLIDRELYLPEHTWIADRERCRAAGIGDEVAFATKPKQFQVILARALDAGVPFAWVTADEAFGQNAELRGWMADRDVAFVMATRSTNLATPGGVSVAELVADQPAGRWHRRSAGTGAHGERIYDWLRIAVPCDVPGRKRWVLARRSISDGELAYYHCFGPANTTLKTLVEVAGARWAIEECFQTAKNECGLDHYQVRKYAAWYRHITLSMAAHACLTVIRAAERARKRGLRSTGLTSW
ncbi:IS701 family transposase [Catenulispora rubra]|uniref:IS701 family transposase n=1 Tax=Catenulispora rubra TaxID=280293 RepID=UPI0018921D06